MALKRRRKRVYYPAHTCVDRPRLPCDACLKIVIPLEESLPPEPIVISKPVVSAKPAPAVQPIPMEEEPTIQFPYDGLTGLMTGWKFGHVFEEAAKRVKRITFIMADLDAFRAKVCDVYGNEVGDQVLIEIADIFRRSCSPIQQCIGPCRFSAAFGVAFLDWDDEAAFGLAEGIREWVEGWRMPNYPELRVTARFAVVTSQASRWNEAMNFADSCVYFWKKPNTVTKVTIH